MTEQETSRENREHAGGNAEAAQDPNQQVGGNVAFKLAHAFSYWRVSKNQAPETARGFEPGEFDDLRVWRWNGEMVDLVRQVDTAVTALHDDGVDVSMFWDVMPRWYAGAYAARAPYGSIANADRAVCSKADMALLQALGALLDAHGAVKLTFGDYRQLQDALEEVRDLLANDVDGLPDDVRRYLRSIILRAQSVLDMIEAVGPDAARSLMVELSGALRLRADADAAGHPDRAKRLRELAWKVVTPFATGAGGETARQLSEVAKKAIESS